jgi:hypothetical protein
MLLFFCGVYIYISSDGLHAAVFPAEFIYRFHQTGCMLPFFCRVYIEISSDGLIAGIFPLTTFVEISLDGLIAALFVPTMLMTFR